MRHPSPFLMNNGVPSTDLKARTGEFTPPGKYVFEISNNSAEVDRLIVCSADILLYFDCKIITYLSRTIRNTLFIFN
jgi:hypothetical protein